MTISAAIAAATVKPEKSAVRPAVGTVRRWASRVAPSLRDLLAVARDHQQRVVDGEAEAERRSRC